MGHKTAIEPVVVCVAIGCLASRAVAQPRHGDNLLIGQSASGQLTAHFDFQEVTVLQLLPDGDMFSGWAGDGPGFETVHEDDPAEDLLALPEGTRVLLEIVLTDPAFTPVDAATLEFLDQPGERKPLGPAPFETHILWLINSADSAFDPSQTVWRAQVRLLDEDGLHPPSEAYTLSFTNVPEPTTLAILAMGVWPAFTRRR